MLTARKTFAQNESGATAIEYGLFAGLLVIGLTAAPGSLPARSL